MWSNPSKPKDIKPIPWLSDTATLALDARLRDDMTVIEFGGGGSTLWIAERVKQVITFENDSDWARAIKSQAPENVRVIASGLWDGVEDADLLFVDGEPVELRGQWLNDAANILHPYGLLVLDNYNRPEYAKEREALRDLFELEYQANSPYGLYLNTEFWRLK